MGKGMNTDLCRSVSPGGSNAKAPVRRLVLVRVSLPTCAQHLDSVSPNDPAGLGIYTSAVALRHARCAERDGSRL